MQITDQQILSWLMSHVGYLELKGAREMKTGGWWPVTEQDDPSQTDPEDIGLDLCEWVERQIKLEKGEV